MTLSRSHHSFSSSADKPATWYPEYIPRPSRPPIAGTVRRAARLWPSISRLDSCTASPRSLSMPIFQSPKHTKISKSSGCKISVQSSSRGPAKCGHAAHGQYPWIARSNTVKNRHFLHKPLTHHPKNQPPRQREVAPQPPLADPDPTTGTEQFWRENTS